MKNYWKPDDFSLFTVPYCIIFCKVLKREVQKFEDALEKLKDKKLLLGHRDYVDVCDEIAMLINREVTERKIK